MPICRVCGVALTLENWSPSRKEWHGHICKSCDVKESRKWQKNHPKKGAHSSKAYMRRYMKDYRERHRERINEIGRLENYRRDRELSTDTILNEHFKGAHLHHITPSVAVYIPEELHTSVSHNLKTGRGMDEMNARATEWLHKSL